MGIKGLAKLLSDEAPDVSGVARFCIVHCVLSRRFLMLAL